MACFNSINITNPITNEKLAVPCGKCHNCKKRRASGWSFRLVQEGRVHNTAFFITLTYDTRHVPITQRGFMSLKKSDLQKYWKKVRKQYPPRKIKYYAVGEYGDQTERPHYHAIVYGALEEDLREQWKKGQVHVGAVTEASIGYTLKYLDKPVTIPKHRNDDRVPQFSTMSKGIGKNYVENRENIQWHHQDMLNRYYLETLDGKKIAIPRYYKERLYSDEERDYLGKLIIKHHTEEMLKKTPEEMEKLIKIEERKRLKYQRNKKRGKL